jgi:hypothetical protein
MAFGNLPGLMTTKVGVQVPWRRPRSHGRDATA